MDQIIIWGVIWLVVFWAALPVMLPACAGLGLFIAGDDEGALVGSIIGWLAGIGIMVFAVIQVILHVVHLIQYAAGVA